MVGAQSVTVGPTSPGGYSLAVYRGDTAAWRFKLWLDSFKTVPADLTDVLVASQIRTRPGGDLILQIPLSVTLPNIIDANISATQTALFPQPIAVWDLQLTDPTGDVITVLSGFVNTTPDITQ